MKGRSNLPEPNPHFHGREEILDRLHAALHGGGLPPAISGLGGIGKTQTALQYAHRHSASYPSGVFWVVAQNETTLNSSFSQLAERLDLPEQAETEHAKVVAAVQRWFGTHEGWLLVFDNADDLALTQRFLPDKTHGHVIYTTQARNGGRFARILPLEKFSHPEGAKFLLQRTGEPAALETPTGAAALAISEAVDGLPLALEYAGAYIQDNDLGIPEYLNLYQTEGVRLLNAYGSLGDPDHASVWATYSLAFEQLAQQHPAAAELLNLCALLASDDIPEALFTEHPERLGDELQTVAREARSWAEFIGLVCRRSLLTRNKGNEKASLNVHRMVQEVLREQMEAEKRTSTVALAADLLSDSFPKDRFAEWSHSERLLPHVTAVLENAAFWVLPLVEVGRLANQTAGYLEARAQHTKAEPLFVRALAICEVQLGPDHPTTATSLNNLAYYYYSQGQHQESESLYVRALAIKEAQLGPDHSGTANSLNNLAALYNSQGQYQKAEPLYVRALEIRQAQLGPDHPNTANSLNNLATLYKFQGHYEKAELFYVQALAICEAQLRPDHPNTATTLNNLAGLYVSQGQYQKAEPLFLEALAIREAQLGPDHPSTAASLNNLASMYGSQELYQQAEPLYLRALAIREAQVGPVHPDTANLLNNLSVLYYALGRYQEAKTYLMRALKICESRLGLDHPDTVLYRENYEILQQELGEA